MVSKNTSAFGNWGAGSDVRHCNFWVLQYCRKFGQESAWEKREAADARPRLDLFFAMLIVLVGRKQLISSSLARACPAGAKGERMRCTSRCPMGTSAGRSKEVCMGSCPRELQEASLPEPWGAECPWTGRCFAGMNHERGIYWLKNKCIRLSLECLSEQ